MSMNSKLANSDPMDVDLNTAFKNAAVSFRAQASELAETLRELDADLDRPAGQNPPGYERVIVGKIERATADRAKWLRMAESAEVGIYLLEQGPASLDAPFPELLSAARAQGRVRYVKPLSGD